jgi:hypothetical protein
MKTIKVIILSLLSLVFVGQAHALTPDEKSLLGKWTLSVSGLPQGDVTLEMNIYDENDSLRLWLLIENDTVRTSDVTLKEKVLTFTINANDRDATFEADITDPNTLEGTLMDSYDFVAKRIDPAMKKEQ